MDTRNEKLHLNTIPEALEALRRGEIIIVTDDEDRENEGDFICSANHATPENINFMATYGKGLICMPISSAINERLGLVPMVAVNTDNHQTAFTVSIDAVETTTGISAYERSHTALKVADESSSGADFRAPGHMFPLLAKDKGVLERNGHTEATVDLVRLAGLGEAGLCCEIMADDGTMMKTGELHELASRFNLKFITIKALQEYRRQNEVLVEQVASPLINTAYGQFRAYGYVDTISGEHHVAFVKGELDPAKNILCRVHSECLTGDVFKSLQCDCGDQLDGALRQIAAKGAGVLLYMRQEGRGIGLINKLKAYELQNQGLDTCEANLALGYLEDLREYHLSAMILKDLGITNIDLITNNPDKVAQLEKYGLQVDNLVALKIEANEFDYKYLKTKKEKMGHYLDL